MKPDRIIGGDPTTVEFQYVTYSVSYNYGRYTDTVDATFRVIEEQPSLSGPEALNQPNGDQINPMVDRVNFAGVKTEFEPIEAGIYECEFADYKFGKTSEQSRSPGETKVDLQFKVVEEDDGYQNRRLFRTCTFAPEALWAFKRTMKALGAEVDWEDPEGIDPEAVCRSVKGAHANVAVSLRDYEDPKDIDPETGNPKVKKQNQIDDVRPTEAMLNRLRQEAAAAATSGGVEVTAS